VALSSILCDGELEIIPIIGGKTREQIEDSFAALDIKLSRGQFDRIFKNKDTTKDIT
jgi:aryl-alcohol dehydrogenase-like predicted oxidoreductase